MTEPTTADRFVTDIEAGALLDLSPGHLRHLRVRGDGPPYANLGRAVRYHVPTLLDWAKSKTVASTSSRALH
jgi:hypothetical protein